MVRRNHNRSGSVRWPVLVAGLLIALSISIFAMGKGRTTDTRVSYGPDRQGDSLIAVWMDSLGGMETYDAFQSASFTVSTILYDTLTGRTKRERPRYVWIKKGPKGEETRVERWETYGFIEQGFDGEDAWATIDGVAIPDTAKDHRESLYVSRDLFYWMGLPFKLRDPGVNLQYLGLINRPGAEIRKDPHAPEVTPPVAGYHAVEVSFGENVGEHDDVFTYYFEPGAGFPVEVTYVEEGRTSINRALWGETGRGDTLDYPYPIRRDFIVASGKMTKSLAIYDVVINPELSQKIFETPDGGSD
jgi:hypothetical protein